MDQNFLYRRHQIELIRAMAARSPEARAAHADRARGYQRLIEINRRRIGGSPATAS